MSTKSNPSRAAASRDSASDPFFACPRKLMRVLDPKAPNELRQATGSRMIGPIKPPGRHFCQIGKTKPEHAMIDQQRVDPGNQPPRPALQIALEDRVHTRSPSCCGNSLGQILSSFRLRTLDHAGNVGPGPILAHLPLAFQPRDRNCKSHDALQHAGDEICRRI